MIEKLTCPKEYSETNPENSPCERCGSRVHYTIGDGLIRCSWCEWVMDETMTKGS